MHWQSNTQGRVQAGTSSYLSHPLLCVTNKGFSTDYTMRGMFLGREGEGSERRPAFGVTLLSIYYRLP